MLVTADEIPDPYDLTMIARVNGEEWGRGNPGSMHGKFGDVVELEVSGLGVLRNRVLRRDQS